MDFATIILTLMSRDNLGEKQTIVLNNCLIQNETYNVVITLLDKNRIYYIEKTNTKEGNTNKTKANC